MLFLNVYLFLILFGFIVIPYAVLNLNGYNGQVTGTSVSGVDTTNAATCSALYTVNISSDAASAIQDFIQGTVRMSRNRKIIIYTHRLPGIVSMI